MRLMNRSGRGERRGCVPAKLEAHAEAQARSPHPWPGSQGASGSGEMPLTSCELPAGAASARRRGTQTCCRHGVRDQTAY